MMLDPLGVALGGFGVEAQAQQEPQHDLVPPTALPGQRAALVGEEHGPIPRPGDQALPGQTVERLGHRRDPDAKPRGDIHRPRLADGYALEGHVPAVDIRRLLAERPDAVGLAVPGMPYGSPGMGPEDERDAYDVLLIRRDGSLDVYSRNAARS